jgi:PAT family beta-lactamase induction signal transducer AmpG
MVAAGSGALIIAHRPEFGWTGAYLAIAVVAFLPLIVLTQMKAEPGHGGSRSGALAAGLVASGLILLCLAGAVAAVGWVLLEAASGIGISSDTNVTPWVLGLCMLPFLVMAAALPRIRKLPPSARVRRSAAIGPYVDFFWRYGFMALAVMAFVSIYRMGDVLALGLSKPMILGLGYTKDEIGWADGLVALLASIVGVGIGGWMAARWRQSWALTVGALFAAFGNFAFVWLAHQPVSNTALYAATAADQFGNGMAGTIFVVYLSLLVNPRYAGAQYAFLSGFAFMLPRLLAGAGGTIVERFDAAGLPGWDVFFLISGIASLAAILFLPLIARARPREPDEPRGEVAA